GRRARRVVRGVPHRRALAFFTRRRVRARAARRGGRAGGRAVSFPLARARSARAATFAMTPREFISRFVLALAAALGLAGCLQDPGVLVDSCPDVKTFSAVSPLLEQRCGSLDCHGNIARPL